MSLATLNIPRMSILGTDVDATDMVEYTPLHVAARGCHEAVVKLLVDAGE